ncbi:MAG: metallophosphoesterase family protein [Flavobacteriales bacterium]|nr:metallophosphoesterase family protein [Flavobacteriales bacterium]
MKRIGLLSDTHGYLDEGIKKHFADCDEIWHAGDIGTVKVSDTLAAWKLYRAVYGNIDGGKLRLMHPENQIFEVEGVKVLMTHIGGYPGRYASRVRELIIQEKPKLYICGHSHILKVMFDKKHQVLHMNPGAAGISGFHQVKTMLRFVLDQGEIKDLEVIELGKRTENRPLTESLI